MTLETVANVNSNHSVVTRSGKMKLEVLVKDPKLMASEGNELSNKLSEKTSAKSNVHHFQFEEDGEMVQMEINDGAAAATEFASDEETGPFNEDNSGSESDDSETSFNEGSMSEQESIEIWRSQARMRKLRRLTLRELRETLKKKMQLKQLFLLRIRIVTNAKGRLNIGEV